MRNCEYIGTPAMFQSRVMGVGTLVARLDDGTETTFYPAGKKYQFTSRPSEIVFENGVPKIVEGQPSLAVMYDLQVTVKDYVLGSGKVKHTDWGKGLYPGFNPTPNWVTIPEEQFVAMYPEWVDIRNAKFGGSTIGKFEMESQKRLKDAEKWRSNTPIVSFTTPNASGVARTINVYGYNKELGEVWFDEGPNSSAANSQLIPEIFLAAKIPEWVAAKESLYKSSGGGSGGGSVSLPLLLGAAYLLLA